MGSADAITKEYMKDNEIFADVYNFLLGKKVLDPEKLSHVDVEELYITSKLPGDTDKDVQKFRDVLKQYATAMTDGQASYVLLGIESQLKIDYSMVVRIFIYDAMRYYKQLQQLEAKHKKEKDSKTSEEFLSHFHKTDRLMPVITVVVYYGSKPWDASLDLFGLLEDGYDDFKPLMNNYQIKVFEAATMTDEDLRTLESNLRLVMTFIKGSGDVKKLTAMVENDEAFKRIDKLSVHVINAVTDAGIQINEKEETIDMCQAIKDLKRISIAEGEARGEEKGKASEKLSIALKMLKDGLSLEFISKYSEISIDELQKLATQNPA